MKILHLTLKKKWFDMILSGEKTEEYRDIKPYWTKRFKDFLKEKPFDIIRFRNGYAKDSPTFDIELKNIEFGFTKKGWSNNQHVFCYVLKLGSVLI